MRHAQRIALTCVLFAVNGHRLTKYTVQGKWDTHFNFALFKEPVFVKQKVQQLA